MRKIRKRSCKKLFINNFNPVIFFFYLQKKRLIINPLCKVFWWELAAISNPFFLYLYKNYYIFCLIIRKADCVLLPMKFLFNNFNSLMFFLCFQNIGWFLVRVNLKKQTTNNEWKKNFFIEKLFIYLCSHY